MAAVKGIGGAFVLSEDPERLANWYTEMLGIELSPQSDEAGFYRVFETRDAETDVLRANPVLAIQQSDGKVADEGRNFVLNLRVDDLRTFVEGLDQKGVSSSEVVEDPYGLFTSIRDLDGNRIELYEERFPDSES
jgi:catechol 2,3-dioxygenase-like lactoylglutathione lyase family enzyme